LTRYIDVDDFNMENDAPGIPVHWLSKDARFRIIETLISTRSLTDLAKELGVTSTAIRKYMKRETHPSDEVILKALSILAPYEEEKVYSIIISDLVSALRLLYKMLDEKYREKVRKLIEEVILEQR